MGQRHPPPSEDASRALQRTIEEVLLRLHEVIQGRTFTELALRTGIHSETLRRAARGESRPSLELVIAVCQAHNLSAHWLLFGDGPKYADDIVDRKAMTVPELVAELEARAETVSEIAGELAARLRPTPEPKPMSRPTREEAHPVHSAVAGDGAFPPGSLTAERGTSAPAPAAAPSATSSISEATARCGEASLGTPGGSATPLATTPKPTPKGKRK